MACLVCRSRKIRCDRAEPECRQCQNLGVTCPGYTLQDGMSRGEIRLYADAIYSAAGMEKRRVGSCDACRATKHRCTKAYPTCARCQRRGIQCVYRSSSTSEQDIASSPSTPQASLQGVVWPMEAEFRSRLLRTYFDRVHPLRCLSFIHKPSFMYALDHGTLLQNYEEPLILVMCALGARQLCLSLPQDDMEREQISLDVSSNMAEVARTAVMAHIHTPTIQQLMTMVLLCEYASRTDGYALVFVLVGCIFRQLCLLGLANPGEDPDSEARPMEKETECRLAWACYSLDVLISSGVDRNSSWRGDVPQISLPCADVDFLSQTVTDTPLLSQVLQDITCVRRLDLTALNTISIYLRTRVLRCIRSTISEGDIWASSSPFMTIVQQLETLYRNIPEKYTLTDFNVYTHKEQHILGAVFFLHLLYHTALCDLTRISLPGFSFPLSSAFRNAPAEFVSQCQQRCLYHAEEISNLIRKGLIHGPMAFDDPLVADATFESTKIQVVYFAILSNGTNRAEVKDNIMTNFQLLQMITSTKTTPSQHITALLPLCKAFGFQDVVDQWQGPETLDIQPPPEVTGPAYIHHLSKMAPFRRARLETKPQYPDLSSTPSNIRDTNSQLGRSRGVPPIISTNTELAEQMQSQGIGSLDSFGIGNENIAGTLHNPDTIAEAVITSSLHDYSRTAEEMSYLLTWDAMDYWNVGGQTSL